MSPLETLKSVTIFQATKPENLQKLASLAKEKKCRAGTFLMREGEEASSLYLIQEGRVALEVHLPGKGAIQLESLGSGDIAGISWLFAPYQWQLDARAVESVVALSFDGATLRAKMEEDHHFGYDLMRPLLAELYERLRRVRLQRLDLYKSEPRGVK